VTRVLSGVGTSSQVNPATRSPTVPLVRAWEIAREVTVGW
jgi:hypothetical protein